MKQHYASAIFANSSRFCWSVTNVVMALKIFTLLFPEVVTEKVSALILAISINVASNNVEKSPFPVNYIDERVYVQV